MKATVKLPYVAWRDGRPRFVPGARERALGFRGEDLRHQDGRWFSLVEAQTFAADRLAEIQSMRGKAPVVSPPRTERNQRGYVYFLRCGDWLKVGFSKTPTRRLGELATGIPHKITAWASVPGTRHDEARVHASLRPYRLKGEWFSYQPKVAEVMIRSVTFGCVMLDEIGNLSHDGRASRRVRLSHNPTLFSYCSSVAID